MIAMMTSLPIHPVVARIACILEHPVWSNRYTRPRSFFGNYHLPPIATLARYLVTPALPTELPTLVDCWTGRGWTIITIMSAIKGQMN